MTPDEMQNQTTRNAASIATATHDTVTVAYTAERLLQELRAECMGSAILTATPYGTYLQAPFDKTATTMLKAIGAQWNQTEKVWVIKSERHLMALRIATFCYSDVAEYEEFDGYTQAIYPDAM